jgi:hypothetical protein
MLVKKVMGNMLCSVCGYGELIKYGFTSSGKQRYQCKHCGNVLVYSSEQAGVPSTELLAAWIKRLDSDIQELQERVKDLEADRDIDRDTKYRAKENL